MALRVLLVQTETKPAQALSRYFAKRSDEVWKAWDLAQGESLLKEMPFDLLLVDIAFPPSSWLAFLQRIRSQYPKLHVIITHKYPDLRREMAAREHGFTVFVRQPYTREWLDRAIQTFEELDGKDARSRPAALRPSRPMQAVRMPMRVKITLPYLILAILFALGGAYIVSQVIVESVQERYLNQLFETGLQNSDWMVRQENNMLSTIRLMTNSQGIPEAVRAGDAEGLRTLLLPLAVNAGEEAVDVLSLNGTSVLSMRHPQDGGPADYLYSSGAAGFSTQPFVQEALSGRQDQLGDKYAGLVQLEDENYLYIASPIYDDLNQVAGAILVGRDLKTLTREMKQETLAEVTLYDLKGVPLASTLYTEDAGFPLLEAQVDQILAGQDESSLTRDLTRESVNYTELLGPWEVRSGSDIGLLGVSLGQSFLVRTTEYTRLEIFVLVAGGILLVVVVGLYLSRLITHPLQQMLEASNQVALGNLEVKLNTSGDDELGALASSFNYMVAGLQEGFIYRDILGRTVSPEVREQLRDSFSSGELRLAGQEAVATVLMADIRGFTTLSEKTDPALVFEWLNDYFGRLVPIITQYGGVVNKFDGDAILAFFGILPAVVGPTQSALSACQAAVEMLDAIDEFNRNRVDQGLPRMMSGIGINTGLVMAGGLGTMDRMHYTIIGDTVNTAQRMESLTRSLFTGSGAVISQSTYEALDRHRSDFNLNLLGQRAVKGKVEQVRIYRLQSLNKQEGLGVML